MVFKILIQLLALCFRQREGKKRGDEKPRRWQEERSAQAVSFGQSADGERSGCGKPPPDVIAQAHRRSANLSRKNLAGDGAEAGEKSGSEERHERAEDKQPKRALRQAIHRHKRRRNQQVGEIGLAPAVRVAKKSEQRITNPLSRAQHEKEARRLDQSKSAATLRRGQRQIRRYPGEQSPVPEHTAGVHGRRQRAVAKNVLAQQEPQRAARLRFFTFLP